MNNAKPTARLTTPTDLGANAQKDIAGALNALLADTFALYMKTKNFHWHVSGPHFRDYHLLFDEHAEQIFATTDVLAERVRKLGGTTLRSIGDITRHQPVRRKLYNAVAIETGLPQQRLGGPLAEVKIIGARPQIEGHRTQFVGGLGQGRQRADLVDIGEPSAEQISQLGSARVRQAARQHRIADADKGQGPMASRGELAQRTQRPDRWQHGQRVIAH